MGAHILGEVFANEIHLKGEACHTKKQEDPEHLSGDRILIRVGVIPIIVWIVWSLGYRVMMPRRMRIRGWVSMGRL